MFRVVLLTYCLMSVITFAMYGIDKRAAIKTGRRVREKTLHLLALCGGWPGALIAQQVFKHKRRKRAFMFTTWAITMGHVVCWVWYTWSVMG